MTKLEKRRPAKTEKIENNPVGLKESKVLRKISKVDQVGAPPLTSTAQLQQKLNSGWAEVYRQTVASGRPPGEEASLDITINDSVERDKRKYDESRGVDDWVPKMLEQADKITVLPHAEQPSTSQHAEQPSTSQENSSRKKGKKKEELGNIKEEGKKKVEEPNFLKGGMNNPYRNRVTTQREDQKGTGKRSLG